MWKIIFILIAFAIFITYTSSHLIMFGIPHSLSQTYYQFKERKNWLKFLFPTMMISIAGFLLPAWLEISEYSDFQFTTFLACSGLIFTGICPAFRESKHEDVFHTVSAYFAVVMAFLWVILVAKLWWIIPICVIIVLSIALISKTIKTSYTYWLEFASIFATIISILTRVINTMLFS